MSVAAPSGGRDQVSQGIFFDWFCPKIGRKSVQSNRKNTRMGVAPKKGTCWQKG
jgi:hypothetical protein